MNYSDYEKANPREELIPFLIERHFRIPHSEITFVGLFGFYFSIQPIPQRIVSENSNPY